MTGRGVAVTSRSGSTASTRAAATRARPRSATGRASRSSIRSCAPTARSTSSTRCSAGPAARSPTPCLGRIQNELFDLGADVCVPFVEGDGRLRVTQAAVDRLEADCDEANASLPELTSFILPGGSEAASRLHVARTVCRRAELEVIDAAGSRPVNPLAAVYLNRLSDLLFILARAHAGESQPLWKPGGGATGP